MTAGLPLVPVHSIDRLAQAFSREFPPLDAPDGARSRSLSRVAAALVPFNINTDQECRENWSTCIIIG